MHNRSPHRMTRRYCLPNRLRRVFFAVCVLLLIFSTAVLQLTSFFILPAATSKGSFFKTDRNTDGVVEGAIRNVSSIQELIRAISRNSFAAAQIKRIFSINTDVAPLKVPPSFRQKAVAMFAAHGGREEDLLRLLESQTVVEVRNKVTGEVSVFNDVRRLRPGGSPGPRSSEEEKNILDLYTVGGGASQCDFCSQNRTAEDIFGRVVGRHAYTASNIAKLSRWHGLVVAAAHNPLLFNLVSLEDMLRVSVEWFRRAHRADPRHTHPNIICDIGPRASASQVHLHMQTALTRDFYFSGTSQLMAAASRYGGVNYWNDLVEAHTAAGLAVRVGDSVVISSLCPRKERELLVLGESPADPSFARAVAVALTALRDGAYARAISFAISFPPLNEKGHFTTGKEPAIMRVIDRGSPLDPRSDTGALEYFGTTYIAADPYAIVPHLIVARDATR